MHLHETVEHIGSYLDHDGDCLHCRRIGERAIAKLYHAMSTVTERQIPYLTSRLLGDEQKRALAALTTSEDVIRQCIRDIQNEWRERQESWL